MTASLGTVLRAKGENRAAAAMLRKVLEGRRATLGDADEATIRSVLTLANFLYAQDEEAQAEPLYREAASSCQLHLGEKHELTITALNNLGCLLKAETRLRNLGEAEEKLNDSLVGCRKLYGDSHVETLIAASNLGRAQTLLGRHDDAYVYIYHAFAGLVPARSKLGESHARVLYLQEKLDEHDDDVIASIDLDAPDAPSLPPLYVPPPYLQSSESPD